MARMNKRKESLRTHEGAKAKRINPEMQLRRSVLACMLWEKSFYEDGIDIAERIIDTVPHVDPKKTKDIAIQARNDMKLRHAPLLIARAMAQHTKHKKYVAETLENIIQRPDELPEFLSIYWRENKIPIANQVKIGLGEALRKFDEYQLAKWDQKGKDIRIRDVLFLTHPQPKGRKQETLWRRLADDKLKTPDTWEVSLSSGKDKKETWERLMIDNKLGAMAFLRNLRNMEKEGVNKSIIREYFQKLNTERILPYRFIAAARYAPDWEDELEACMLKCLNQQNPLYGETVVLVDVSGSMSQNISDKSDMTRMDAACGMAILLREICEDIRIFTFSVDFKKIPPRHGFALRDAIVNSQDHMGTLLGQAVSAVYGTKNKNIPTPVSRWFGPERTFTGQGLSPNRLIVFTDEQSHDPVPDPKGRAYMINVASYENGVGYGAWHHIDGWSEHVIRYIQEYETMID